MRPSYRFKHGKFAGKTMEQVMLRRAPDLYRVAAWAEAEGILPKMLKHFALVRQKLEHATVHAHCSDPRCGRKAKSLTLPSFYRGGWLPRPYYWCDKHGPWETEGISPKLPIHFDTIKAFSDKGGQQKIHKKILRALGVKKGTRITEDFAHRFFAHLT